ncbi:MAG: hypothetical protein SGILL_005181 [Bacillariaceae sp.]
MTQKAVMAKRASMGGAVDSLATPCRGQGKRHKKIGGNPLKTEKSITLGRIRVGTGMDSLASIASSKTVSDRIANIVLGISQRKQTTPNKMKFKKSSKESTRASERKAVATAVGIQGNLVPKDLTAQLRAKSHQRISHDDKVFEFPANDENLEDFSTTVPLQQKYRRIRVVSSQKEGPKSRKRKTGATGGSFVRDYGHQRGLQRRSIPGGKSTSQKVHINSKKNSGKTGCSSVRVTPFVRKASSREKRSDSKATTGIQNPNPLLLDAEPIRLSQREWLDMLL